MSEKDETRKQRKRPLSLVEQFNGLIENAETRDAGIVQFEVTMAAEREALEDEWVGAAGIPVADMRDVEDRLNRQWMYGGDSARITGRVYVPSACADMVPDVGFEEINNQAVSSTDEEDEIAEYDYQVGYYVEDVMFISHGVEVSPRLDDDGNVEAIRIDYLFSVESDGRENRIFTADPKDLFCHQYETMTPQEAQVRLMRDWPVQLKLIEDLIRPDPHMSLMQRLHHLNRRLQVDMSKSPELLSLVRIYTNHRAAFDDEHPYSIRAAKYVDCYDGADPTNTEDGGVWLQVNLSSPITFVGYKPAIEFTSTGESRFKTHIIVRTHNQEDGDTPEYVAIPVNHIESFRSTKLARSLLQTALLLDGVHTYSVESGEALPELSELSANNDEVSGVEIINEGALKRPRHVEEMELFEAVLKEIQLEVRHAAREIYGTQEIARQKCIELNQNFITSRLVGAGVTKGFELELSGENAVRVNIKQRDDGDPHTFTFSVDQDNPLKHLDHGDSYRAVIRTLRAGVSERRDVSGDVVGYSVQPALVVHYHSETRSVVAYEETSLADANVELRSIVPLDGSVDIRVAQLEEFRREVEAIEAATQAYPKEVILKSIYKLQQAVYGEVVGGRSLRDVQLVSHFGEKIYELEARGKKTTYAIEAVATLFVGRDVTITGGSLVEGMNGNTEYRSNETIFGEIVDVRSDKVKGDLVFVLQIDEEFHYVPFSTITAMVF